MALAFVFDVESIGLHGDGFAVGYVVVDEARREYEFDRFACHPDTARGDDEGRSWVDEHCPRIPADFADPKGVREAFWAAWLHWHDRGAIMVADCAWPVEARFLADCIDDDSVTRAWAGPYPLHDVATARLCAGLDPLATVERLPDELPQHDPLADARQSARLWCEAVGAP